MALQTSATINGRTYSRGNTFVTACNFTAKAASDGTGNNHTVPVNTTYQFLYYNPGSSYPYAIGKGGTVYGWARAAVFPYATYTVSYNANSGSGAPGAQTKTYGSNLTLSSTKPTRTGYTFQGWATSASGSVAYNPGSVYTSNSAITLYAVWKINTYTVSYNANNGSGAPGAQTKTYGTDLVLSTTKPTRTGYTFQGWATSASGAVAYAAGATYTANAAVTLYAVWKINTYAVNFDANGGSGAPGAQTKTYGTDLVLSTTKPTRTGYTFQGWATSAGGSVSYSAGAKYTSNSAIKLYAVWTANGYVIAFNANGGAGAMGNEPMTYDVSKALTANTFTKAGHTFQGWATSAGGVKVYDNAATVKNLTSAAEGVVTLYAVWSTNTYSITFNATRNGGSPDKTVQYKYGNELQSFPTASKKYYVFDGWYTQPTGGTKITEKTLVTGDAIYYAHFIIDASVNVRTGGKFKPGFPYVRVNGQWKKGYFYVRKNGKWQQGLSE